MGDAADARRELAAARAAAKGKGGVAAAPPDAPKKEEKKAGNRASRAEDALQEQVRAGPVAAPLPARAAAASARGTRTEAV
jgi:hypothetical protein